MTDLFSPEKVSMYFLAIFFILVVAAIVSVWRFFKPLLIEKHQSKTKVDEANAQLAVSLVATTEKQAELQERCVDMGHTALIRLDEHGRTLEFHGQALSAIGRKIGAELPDPPHRTTTIVPALEVGKSGEVQAVLLAETHETKRPSTAAMERPQ